MEFFKNLSARDKKISMYLIGILLVIVVYAFAFNPLMDRYSAQKATQDDLQRQVDQLTEINDNLDKYKSDTAKLNNELSTFMEDFKPDLKEEDSIVFAKGLEDNTAVDISSMAINERFFVYTMGTESAEVTTEPGEPIPAGTLLIPETLYAAPTTIELEGTYEQIKKLLSKINLDVNKKAITNFSLGYNSSNGKLFGSVTMNNYFLTDSDKIYEAPELKKIQIGLSDIFGTIDFASSNEDSE